MNGTITVDTLAMRFSPPITTRPTHRVTTRPAITTGTDYVVRGGCYNDDASELRCAARRHSDYEAWLKTDPQNPKSIWWLSDIKGIGFRVVCDAPERP